MNAQPYFLDHIWLIPLFPLATAAVMLFFGRRLSNQIVSWLCSGSVFLSFIFSLGAFFQLIAKPSGERIATKVLEDFRRIREDDETDDSELYVLSERESEILDLVAQGMRNKEIASKLSIAEKTVKNHVSNILKALQVNSRTEAAMKAVKARLVEKN